MPASPGRTRDALRAACKACKEKREPVPGKFVHPAHPVEPAMPGLGQPAGGHDPAEPLLDALAQPLAGGVARMPGGASVDPGLARLAGLPDVAADGDMRGHGALPQRVHELGHVVGLVGAQRDPPRFLAAPQHGQCRLPLGGAGSPDQRGVDDQRVGVLHQEMAHVAQPAPLAPGLAMEPSIGVGCRRMRRVRAPLAAEVPFGVASGRRVVAVAIPAPEAFIDSHASISVPSTEKCSSDSTRRTRATRRAA